MPSRSGVASGADPPPYRVEVVPSAGRDLDQLPEKIAVACVEFIFTTLAAHFTESANHWSANWRANTPHDGAPTQRHAGRIGQRLSGSVIVSAHGQCGVHEDEDGEQRHDGEGRSGPCRRSRAHRFHCQYLLLLERVFG